MADLAAKNALTTFHGSQQQHLPSQRNRSSSTL
eukprot:CAMPEP_0119551692 /NCGR_PEP_ID=MMETSP1352-20130426/4879_1 /TAXON_ID=265584 /ORGANISM="Stauroneis constricta, Strain CCMP1120" /LENGTH=32 /DNA_ID= /DNA_START= /DNA_END= /DNA_ORIENTATION=